MSTELDFEATSSRIWDLHQQMRLRSAHELAKELREHSKDAGNFRQYIGSNFLIFNTGNALQEYATCKAAAVECVTLLESWQSACRFQPDLEDRHFEGLRHDYLPCAYDELAEATGSLSGYNSRDLDNAVQEGIQVCNLVGKTSCIGCFRSYGASRAWAADDVEMALHYCRSARIDDGKADETKVSQSVVSEAHYLLALGDLNGVHALQPLGQQLSEGTTFEIIDRFFLDLYRANAELLAGNLEAERRPPESVVDLERGQHRSADIEVAFFESERASLQGRHQDALALVEPLDEELFRTGILDRWFDARVRRIALLERAGESDRARALMPALRERAQAADDFHTLRRLALVEAAGKSAWPHAPVGLPTVEPVRIASAGASAEVEAPSDAPAEAPSDNGDGHAAPPEQPSVREDVQALYERSLERGGDDWEAAHKALAGELEAVSLEGLTVVERRHLLTARSRVFQPVEDPQATLNWCLSVAKPAREDARVMGLLAQVATELHQNHAEALADVLAVEAIQNWAEESVRLDPDDVAVRAYAAYVQKEIGDAAKAERHLARAARLDRSDVWVAQTLAEMYRQSDRDRDALAVLDLCLRSGAQDLGVLWDAAMAANGLDDFQSMHTYLTQYTALNPDYEWGHYYLLLAADALGQDDQLAERLPQVAESAAHLEFAWLSLTIAHRTRTDQPVEEALERMVSMPLEQLEFFTAHGLHANLMRVLKLLVEKDPEGDSVQRVRTRMLRLGLFNRPAAQLCRAHREEQEQTEYFDIEVVQALDPSWKEDPRRPAGTEDWAALKVSYGVLEESEAAALALVRDLHPDFSSQAPNLRVANRDERTYTDRRGLFAQSRLEAHEQAEAAEDQP